jgi:hypothetical protein
VAVLHPDWTLLMETLQVKPEDSSSSSNRFYVWEVPDKRVAINLDFGVVDRLLLETMRGFGAIPRRGAEVGGILLGSAEVGEKTVIRVEDFEPVLCEHRRGPSFLLSETDTARFEEALSRHRFSPEKRIYAVGCYRSHTREGMTLSPEDLKHFDGYFPEPSSIFLLVKPYATKVSIAGFFFREEGGKIHTEAPYHEFPFRRRELGGGASPAKLRESSPVASAISRDYAYPGPAEDGHAAPAADYAYDEAPVEETQYASHDSSTAASDVLSMPRVRKTNVWIPLSFIFLLLGTLVGFQAAITYRPAKAAGVLADPYSLSLSVGRSGDYLHVRWDRHAQAVRSAQRGVLTIVEGTYDKKVDLDVLQLQNPTVYYRNMSDTVSFRLEIYTKERVAVSETFEWKK